MKSIQVLSIAVIITLSVLTASAQAPSKAGAIPENGFWEVITNEAASGLATVKFYDLSSHLIYEEHLAGVRLDLTRRKTCRRLNQSLQSALVAWEENKQLLKDQGFVAAQFGTSFASKRSPR